MPRKTIAGLEQEISDQRERIAILESDLADAVNLSDRRYHTIENQREKRDDLVRTIVYLKQVRAEQAGYIQACLARDLPDTIDIDVEILTVKGPLFQGLGKYIKDGDGDLRARQGYRLLEPHEIDQGE